MSQTPPIILISKDELLEFSNEIALAAAAEALKSIQANDEWMNIQQLSKYLKCSESQIRLKIRKEGLPYSNRLGDKRFSKFEVDLWMNNRK